MDEHKEVQTMAWNFNPFKHDTPASNDKLGYDPEDWDRNYDPDEDQEIEHEDEDEGTFEDPYEPKNHETHLDSEAIDEDKNSVDCESCGEQLYWSSDGRWLVCPSCGREMSRSDFFDYIGADIPDEHCQHCTERYPECKDTCWRCP